MKGAAPRFPWVPRSGEEMAQGDAFRRCKDTAALRHTVQNSTRTRNSGTLTQAPKTRSVRAHNTAAHDASTPRPRRLHMARRDQLRRRQQTCERRQPNLWCYAKEGPHGAHLGDAGGDLERSWRRGKTTAPSTRKKKVRGGARRRGSDSAQLASICKAGPVEKRCRRKHAANRGRKKQDGDEFVGLTGGTGEGREIHGGGGEGRRGEKWNPRAPGRS